MNAGRQDAGEKGLSDEDRAESVDCEGLLEVGEVDGFEGVGFLGLHYTLFGCQFLA